MPRPKKSETPKNRVRPNLPRAMWSGSISFGLVNIPVKLYNAIRSKDIHFHMLHGKDHARLVQKLVCSAENKEIERSEVVKGYEIAPDQHIVVEEVDLDAIEPEASRAIDIVYFADLAEIDPIFFDRAYYLLPDERAAKAYALFAKALSNKRKVAIGKFVMRNKEYMCGLRILQGIVCLETLHHGDEVLFSKELDWLPPPVDVGEREVKTAEQLIESLSAVFDPDRIKDEYRDAVLKMIEKKAEGSEIVLNPAPAKKRDVVDLMSALEASLANVRKGSEEKKWPIASKRKSKANT